MAASEEMASEVDEQPSERRSFFGRLFKAVLGLWGVAFFGVVASYLKTPTRTGEEKARRVGPLSELEIGQARFVAHKSSPFWIIRAAGDQLIALPATCTHLRCVLQWEKESGRLVCPCHAGAFDLNGNVLAGPPPRPLQPLRVETKGGIIYVDLS
jgi:cytochrome b6-f complex iron-sulfur subunit